MKYTFLYHRHAFVSFEAQDCKHYSGHAVLINATILDSHEMYHTVLSPGRYFTRFNIALNGNLLGMYPEEI